MNPAQLELFDVRMWNKGDPLNSEFVAQCQAHDADDAELEAELLCPGFDFYEATKAGGRVMANLKNWLPEMSPAELAWFDKCPKAVLFAICQQIAMRIAGGIGTEAAFDVMQGEWNALHDNGLVPQKPPRGAPL